MIHLQVLQQMNEERIKDMRRDADQQRLIRIAQTTPQYQRNFIRQILLATMSIIPMQGKAFEKGKTLTKKKLYQG